MTRTVTAAEELNDLPLGSLIKDRYGDNALKFSKSLWVYPESSGLGVNYIAKHYDPFTVLHEPGKEEPTPLPHRDQVVDVLVMSPLADTAGTDLAPFHQTADALLELLENQ